MRLQPALLPYRRMVGRFAPFLLLLWFMLMNLQYLRPWQFAMDAIIYHRAANAFIVGADPWQAEHAGYSFAAAPPSLLPYIPLGVLPEPLGVVFWMAAGLVAALYALRRLSLPWWWLAFPPMAQALFVGNAQPIVLALLVASARPLAAIAPIMKLYAIPGMVGNWRAMLLAGIALGLSSFFLPWQRYLTDMPAMLVRLEIQALGGHSAYGEPLLFGLAMAALLVLRRRGAQWLLVPALWPATQFHYSVLAMPALNPLLAAGFAIPIRGLPALIVIAFAIVVVVRDAHVLALARSVLARSPLARRGGSEVPLRRGVGES